MNRDIQNFGLSAGRGVALRCNGRGPRGGFTFIEVMFAVLILGFGVIMIAAMLPVAARETQRTREGSTGTAACESGFHVIETLYASSLLPLTDLPATQTNPLNPPVIATYPSIEPVLIYDPVNPAIPLLHQALGSRIDSARRDAAWIPFYERSGALPAQVGFLGVRARNVPTMAIDPGEVTTPAPNYLLPGQFFTSADNCPLPVNFELLVDGYAYDDYLSLDNMINDRGTVYKVEADEVILSVPASASSVPGMEERIIQAAVGGAALVLINDVGQIRVFRLGRPVKDDTTGLHWTLAAGGDVKVTVDAGSPPTFTAEITPGGVYRAYLVGRMLEDPNKPWDEEENPYVGPSQVVQVLEGKVLR